MPHECTDCGRAFEDGSKEMLSGCPNCGGTTFQFRPNGNAGSDVADEPPERPDPEVDGVTRTVGNAASAVRNLVTGGRRPAGPSDTDNLDSDATSDEESAAVGASVETSQSGASAEEPTADESAEVVDPSSTDWPGSDDAETDEEQRVTTTPSGGTAQPEAPDDIVEADEIPSASDRPRDRPPVPDPRPLSARSEDGESGDGDGDESPEDTSGSVAVGDPDERPSLSELRAELNEQFESIRVVEPGQYELNLMELYDREEYIVALQEDGKYTIQLPERWEER